MTGLSRGHLRCSLAPPAEGFTLYAPSLRRLAAGSTLVMATLPVLDWNDELMKDLQALDSAPKHRVLAGILACDPFACWEDVADELTAAGIRGVANFPATAMTAGSGMVDLDDAGFGFKQELDRLAWFAEGGFQMLAVTASRTQALEAWDRLGGSMSAACVIRAYDIDRPADSAITLVSEGELERQGMTPMPIFHLSSG